MPQLPAWVYTFIAVSVTAVWVTLNAIDPFLSGYKVNPELHIVMGALVGASWGGRVVAGKDGKDK
jgi:hypothetical protein